MFWQGFGHVPISGACVAGLYIGCWAFAITCAGNGAKTCWNIHCFAKAAVDRLVRLGVCELRLGCVARLLWCFDVLACYLCCLVFVSVCPP